MAVHPSKKKLMSLSEAVSLVKDGDIVALGGNLSAREPMALIREVIRQGKKNLHCIGGAHGIDVDLLVAGGAVSVVQHSFVGFEGDFGLAPNYRRAVEKGLVTGKETDCMAILAHLRAAAYGVPFMPMGPVRGTDLLKLNPEVKTMECPCTGESVNLYPAIRPDVALIHCHKADPLGNIRLEAPYFADPLLVESSKTVIATVEEIVTEEEMRRLGATFPSYAVTAVAHVPFGAHPTSCYPGYSYDRRHMAEYVKAANGEDFAGRYLAKYVLSPKTHEEYLALVGGRERLCELTRWSESTERWRALCAAV